MHSLRYFQVRSTDRQAILYRILGAYPDTPFSAETTGADTPKANYNQREGPLEAAGRNISQEDKGTMTSDLQPANDAKSGFPVRFLCFVW